ncbi:hypothetical protein UlMin_022749 [Ulmus minor]
MNMCSYDQNAMRGCEGLQVMGSVICPKPRRLGILNPSINDHIRTFRYPISVEITNNQVALSPPFFCGSPPSRASNPIIQDEQFGNGKMAFPSPTPPSKASNPVIQYEQFGCKENLQTSLLL